MRSGVRLAVDVGTVRVGVAASDPSATLATPVTVLRRDHKAGSDIDAIAILAAERDAVEILVGLPRTLRGGESASTTDARAYAATLAVRLAPVPVRLVDERLSTVSATRRVLTVGRSSRETRKTIDAMAAAVILEGALDEERRTGSPPGTAVPV